MVFLVEKTEQRVKRMDYIPLPSGWMKLNYSSSINEHCFQILFRLEVSVKGIILCERKPPLPCPGQALPLDSAHVSPAALPVSVVWLASSPPLRLK